MQIRINSTMMACAAVLLTLCGHALAQSDAPEWPALPTCQQGVASGKEWYNRVLIAGPFRLFYATEGEHAPPDLTDTDGNGHPDRVDDIATQLRAAYWFYTERLGLVSPLNQPRYANSGAIEIRLMRLKSGLGLAFDEPTGPNPWPAGQAMGNSKESPGAARACTLKINMQSSIQASRASVPAHELFHLFQYGYSPFKTRWYLEGMASWAESALAPQRPTIDTGAPMACVDAVRLSYRADRFFQQLSVGPASGGLALEPPARGDSVWAGKKYLDGAPVFKPGFLVNTAAPRKWLTVAGEFGELSSKRAGQDPRRWPEDLQRSTVFDDELCRLFVESVGRP